jgi:acyl transferase domain-containing protein
MLSPEGRCKTLDAAADGYVRAEACGVFILAPVLTHKEHKQLPGPASSSFLALLVGAAVNQDGRSSSLTAPNGPAQQQVIREALAGHTLVHTFGEPPDHTSHFSPSDVVSLSLHGTGTPLGDPVEIGAAAAVLLAGDALEGSIGKVHGRVRKTPLALMSSKSWMGHAEPAAGEEGSGSSRTSRKLRGS